MPGYTAILTIQGTHVGLKVEGGERRLPVDAPRGHIRGWTPAVSGRNARTLRSLDFERLPGVCTIYTGTLKDRPSTSAGFQTGLHGFLAAMRREGVTEYYMLMEWQPRYRERREAKKAGWIDPGGCPHVHGLFFGADVAAAAVRHWLRIMSEWRPDQDGQLGEVARDRRSVAMYNVKHGQRSGQNEQRAERNAPGAWFDHGSYRAAKDGKPPATWNVLRSGRMTFQSRGLPRRPTSQMFMPVAVGEELKLELAERQRHAIVAEAVNRELGLARGAELEERRKAAIGREAEAERAIHAAVPRAEIVRDKIVARETYKGLAMSDEDPEGVRALAEWLAGRRKR